MNARPPCLVSQDEARHQREADDAEAAWEYWREQADKEIQAKLPPSEPRDWFDCVVPGGRCNWSADEILTEAINAQHSPVLKVFFELMASDAAKPLHAALREFWAETQGDAVAKHMQKAAQ